MLIVLSWNLRNVQMAFGSPTNHVLAIPLLLLDYSGVLAKVDVAFNESLPSRYVPRHFYSQINRMLRLLIFWNRSIFYILNEGNKPMNESKI
jgi:hypothetical protein